MRKTIIIYVLATLWAGTSGANPFYRFPDSLFPSGDLNPARLGADGSSVTHSWVKIQWSKKTADQGWVRRNEIYRDLDFSKTVKIFKEAPWRTTRQPTEPPRGFIGTGTMARVLKIQDSWVRLSWLRGKVIQKGWVPETFLQANPKDPGFFLTRRITALKQSPDSQSLIVRMIKSGELMTPLNLTKSWVLVQSGKHKGWINIQDTFSKWNFIVGSFRKDAIATNPHQVLLRGPLSALDQPRPFSHRSRVIHATLPKLFASETQVIQWNHSFSREHGSIWWIDGEAIALRRPRSPSVVLTTKQLFARGLRDIASHPVLTSFKIASAKGLFKTLDGKTWTQIPFFGDHDQPVAIVPSGSLYVGTYVSHDEGRTFTPFLRLDRILAVYQRATGKIPEKLALSRIAYDDTNSKLIISIGKAVFSSADEGRHWIYESEKTRRQSSLLRPLSIELASLYSIRKSTRASIPEHTRPDGIGPN